MPPVVIDIRRADDWRDLVHRAVQVLVEGELVVFPTETVYGLAASALHESAVQKLMQAKGRTEGKALALAVRSAETAWDYLPRITPVEQRLARRCWPGPVTLVFQDGHSESLLNQLPESVRRAVCPVDTIGFRVPAHPLILDVLDLLPGPLVLTSANRASQAEAKTGTEAAASLGSDARLVLDDGPCRFGQASSVIRVGPDGLELLREGVVSRAALRRLAAFMVVLVCTGNTCRSPMAEMLMRQQFAKLLDCGTDELEERGVVVLSAGSAAMDGAPAAPEAIATMKERGLDLTRHAAQPVSERMIRDADLVFTMTHNHRSALLACWPEAAARIAVLSPDGRDVADPIGGPRALYEKCADQIANAIALRLQEIQQHAFLARIL